LPKVGTFRDWLLAEASDDLRQLKSLAGTSKTKRWQ
jgi:LysR family glycine cleavage system transcriptional activator